MLKRRSLLLGLGSLTLGSFLTGCRSSSATSLRVEVLEDSIPAQIFQEFQRQVSQGARLDISPQPQLVDLFDLLKQWHQTLETPPPAGLPEWVPFVGAKRSSPVADLTTLGDYWLETAIRQGLIQPFEGVDSAGWKTLPPQWQALVRRNSQGQPDAIGQIWALPYRWGTMVLIYQVEAFESLGWTPTDWSDLWRPELQGHISLLDSARATIGLTLKQLGHSVNLDNLETQPSLREKLAALHRQVKLYTSDSYLQPLLIGDTWMGVGWSTDVLPVLKRDRRLAAIVPASGSILTADLWVRPQAAPPLPALATEWIDFCWKPETVVQFAKLGLSASPLLSSLKPEELPESVRTNPVLLPSPQNLQQSEFLLPLAAFTVEQYRDLWTAIRQTSPIAPVVPPFLPN